MAARSLGQTHFQRKNAGGHKRRKSTSLPILLFFTTLLISYTVVTVRTFILLPDTPVRELFRRNHVNPAIMMQPDSALKNLRSMDSNTFQEKKPVYLPSLISDENEFETIQHPGYAMATVTKNVTMRVPKFWEPPGGRKSLGEGLMSRSKALSIGRKIPLKTNENEMIETIYVSVASYRDWQCALTVENLFYRAKYPERIRVAVIDQISIAQNDKPCTPTAEDCIMDPDRIICKYLHQIDPFQMDSTLAIGPVFARHLGHRMFRGEYFAMQVDAHVSFVQDWDEDIVNQWKSANNEMAVLTAYLSDVAGSIDETTGKSQHFSRPIMCNTDFVGGGELAFLKHDQQPEGEPGIHGTPTIEPYWAAGFSFARAHFVVNVPYDQYLPMVFQGEEISMGVRGFTYGYDFFTPEKSICFHMYAVGENEKKRNSVKLFWENAHFYQGSNYKAMKRLLGLANMFTEEGDHSFIRTDEEKYGIGKVRTVEKFMTTFGIHLKEKRVEHHLCRFVGKRMQNAFVPFLRPDGMGIDYDKITFEFKDPEPNQNR